MKYERILSFGASPSDSFEIDRTTYKSTDFIIAVDGGITKLRKSGIKPNVFFGDCDSCLSDDKIWINESNFDVNIYPQKKEKSDFELASDFILDNWKNPLEVNIYGMMYGRTDHFLFNIEIAVKMSIHGFEVTFIGENEKLIVSNGLKPIILNVKKNKKRYIAIPFQIYIFSFDIVVSRHPNFGNFFHHTSDIFMCYVIGIY